MLCVQCIHVHNNYVFYSLSCFNIVHVHVHVQCTLYMYVYMYNVHCTCMCVVGYIVSLLL